MNIVCVVDRTVKLVCVSGYSESVVDELVCALLIAKTFLAALPHVPNNYSSSVRGTQTI